MAMFGVFFLFGVFISWMLGYPLSPIALTIGGTMMCAGSLSRTVAMLMTDRSPRPRHLVGSPLVKSAEAIERMVVAEWLADERPAYETVAAFERDVERVLRGDMSRELTSRMPLRRGDMVAGEQMSETPT